MELEKGSIFIDGVDISKIDLATLRSRITVIPQIPALFEGTIRFNLDPWSERSNKELDELVDKFGLKDLVAQELQDGTICNVLEMKVEREGKNISVGAKQVICFIRAALRKNKIVLLDEATASIDVILEQRIQKVMEEEFKHATMVTVAHRLHTIIKSGKILVLDKIEGSLKSNLLEFDCPQVLMNNPNSVFSTMLK